MLPPESTATAGVGEPPRVLQQRRHRGRAGRLDDQLGALQAVQQGPGEVLLGDGHDLVDQARSTCANVTSPGRPTAMPSAIVRIAVSAAGAPAASEAGYAAAPAACTPTTRDVRVGRLTAAAIPASSPPPPMRDEDRGHLRALLEDLQPDRALAGDDVRVVERVDEHGPGALGELVRRREALVDGLRRPARTVGAVAPGGADLGQRAPAPA